MNLLDLFGEVDEIDELISPKIHQSAIKSPPPALPKDQFGFNAFVPPSPVTGWVVWNIISLLDIMPLI